MFDATSEYVFPIRTAQGKIQYAVRFPSDKQWAARAQNRKFLTTRTGRGASETKPQDPPESEVRLIDEIKVNGAPSLTATEAERILDHLAQCEIANVELGDTEARVEMRVLGNPDETIVTHRVNIPLADQVLALRKQAVRQRDLPYNRAETIIYVEPGAALWDTCKGSSEDYAEGKIPNIHKDAAIRAVIAAVDREITDDSKSFQ